MNNPLYEEYSNYLINEVLNPFYSKRLEKLQKLNLNYILTRKNPYLFKAKNIEIASELVESSIDAFIYSSEESLFGNLLEGLAIYISQQLYGGFKSSLQSIDLEFERDNIYYIVSIKSGINWGNSDQVNQMKSNFKKAKEVLRQKGITNEIIAVNGCIYGKVKSLLKPNNDPDKAYYKYAGQEFWQFVSDDENMYKEIIKPIDEKSKERGEEFKRLYAAKVNEMTKKFMEEFMLDNQIDWIKLIDYVSKKRLPTVKNKNKATKKSKPVI